MTEDYKPSAGAGAHPITPPPELVEKWRTAPEYTTGKELFTMVSVSTRRLQEIATEAARWGADQELEACCEWLSAYGHTYQTGLRAARRPKPPSLKEQALESLHHVEAGCAPNVDLLRRALEQLDD